MSSSVVAVPVTGSSLMAILDDDGFVAGEFALERRQ